MDERPRGLDSPVNSPEPGVGELATEIQRIRDDLGSLIAGLDQWRREALDVKLQVRRHPLAVGLAGLGLAAMGAGVVGLMIWRPNHQARPLERARRLGRAVSRMVEDPDRVAVSEPSIGRKILAAAGTAAAGTVAKQLAKRAVATDRAVV